MSIERKGNYYRVQKQVDGVRYNLSFDHYPTQKDIRLALAEAIVEAPVDDIKGTFKEYATKYIELKSNVLSPSTVREYEREINRLPEWFVYMDINEINQEVMQKLVNEISIELSPKTTNNRHAFCVSVIRFFKPSVVFSTTLPKKALKIGSDAPYIPNKEEVQKILDVSKGGRYEIPIRLGCYGLRRSEICALLVKDLDKDNFLTVNKAMVQDKNKEWVIKETKTVESTRIIAIDDELAKMIRALDTDRIFVGYPQTIANFMRRTQDQLNMPHFSLHKLRHYFCTTLSENGVAENDILALGGWKQNSDVMKRVYRHSNLGKDKERLKEIAKNLF